MKRGGITSHELPGQGKTNDWLTPRWILDALGSFDLDPSASESCPNRIGKRSYTWREDGLRSPWHGFVFVNPPYGPHVGSWLTKLADHDNGVALIFARTETAGVSPNLKRASIVLFIAGRLTFETPSGERGKGNSGSPSMLVGFGERARTLLITCSIPGVRMTPMPI